MNSNQKFGERIKVSKAHISKIELSEDNPSDMLIKLICLEFDVNERWIKYGEGEKAASLKSNPKYTELSEEINTTFEKFVNELRNGLDEGQSKLFGGVLKESFENLALSLKETTNSKKITLIYSLKMYIDLLSSKKPNKDLQNIFHDLLHEITYVLYIYNWLLDDVILSENSTEEFNAKAYLNAYTKHHNNLDKFFFELFRSHTMILKNKREAFEKILEEISTDNN